jgi:hypothetical protein
VITGPWRLLGVGLLVVNGLFFVALLLALLASSKTRSFAAPLLLTNLVAIPMTGAALGLAATTTAFWTLLATAVVAWALVYLLLRHRFAAGRTRNAISG